jgi:hypothetical protein
LVAKSIKTSCNNLGRFESFCWLDSKLVDENYWIMSIATICNWFCLFLQFSFCVCNVLKEAINFQQFYEETTLNAWYFNIIFWTISISFRLN